MKLDETVKLRLDEDTKIFLVQEAEKEGRSVANLIRRLIAEYRESKNARE